jgi:GNAT superfamily N-acetyltransferase
MSEVDRTESIAVDYEVVRSTDGLSLSFVARDHDPPNVFPHWDEAGVTRRVEYYQRELADGGAIFGAFAGDRLVGLVVVAARRQRRAEVLGIFVDAGMRRRGIGGKLHAMAEEYARGTGADTMYVYSNPTLTAVGFYRKHGYVLTCLVDEATLAHPPMETCIVLAKRLGTGDGSA